MSTALVTFEFQGDQIEVVPQGDRLLIAPRRVCEILAVDWSGQHKKLRQSAWACVEIMSTHDAKGRKQEMILVDLDTFAMWLSHIDARKVRPSLRPRLVSYQRECAKVLRGHFFGQRSVPTPAPAVVKDPRLDELLRNPEFMHPRAELRHNPREEERIRAMLQCAARAQGVTFHAVHGEIRRTHQVLSYRRLPLYALPPVERILNGYIGGSLRFSRALRGSVEVRRRALSAGRVAPGQLALLK